MKTDLLKQAASYSLDTLKDSFILTFRNFLPLVVAWFISLGFPCVLIFVGTIGGKIADFVTRNRHGGMTTMLGAFIPCLLIGCLWAGWIRISLKAARKEPIRFGDLFPPVSQILSAFVVLVLTSSLIGLGMFLVLPGAFLFLKWQLAPYYIVDQDCGPIEALKRSWQDTGEVFVPLAIFDLCLAGLNAVLGFTGIALILLHIVAAVGSALVYANWLGEEDSRIGLKQILE